MIETFHIKKMVQCNYLYISEIYKNMTMNQSSFTYSK